MDALDRARSTAESFIAEIRSNLEIRQSFNSVFVGRNSELFAYERLPVDLRGKLTRILKLNSADAVVVYRGLLLQLNGVFELFVRQLASAVLDHAAAGVTRYSELPERIRDHHAVYASSVLTKLFSGVVGGVKYSFKDLQANMGACFTDAEVFDLNGEVFTILLGNCTAERLEKLFRIIGLTPPFDDDTGRHAAVKKWAKGAGARAATNKAEAELDRQIDVRDALAHGDITRTVQATDVEEAAVFFEALIGAFCDKARVVVPG